MSPCFLCECTYIASPMFWNQTILIADTLKMVLSRFKFSPELVKSTRELTQVVSHPSFWHRIELGSSRCTLTPHRHWDKPLMSLHLCLRPIRVGSVSTKTTPEPDGSSMVIEAVSALSIGATRCWRSARRPFLDSNIAHHSLTLLRHW